MLTIKAKNFDQLPTLFKEGQLSAHKAGNEITEVGPSSAQPDDDGIDAITPSAISFKLMSDYVSELKRTVIAVPRKSTLMMSAQYMKGMMAAMTLTKRKSIHVRKKNGVDVPNPGRRCTRG
jgi:hypothetical protein